MNKLLIALLPLSLAASAAVRTVSDLPPSPYADTEVSSNVVFNAEGAGYRFVSDARSLFDRLSSCGLGKTKRASLRFKKIGGPPAAESAPERGQIVLYCSPPNGA